VISVYADTASDADSIVLRSEGNSFALDLTQVLKEDYGVNIPADSVIMLSVITNVLVPTEAPTAAPSSTPTQAPTPAAMVNSFSPAAVEAGSVTTYILLGTHLSEYIGIFFTRQSCMFREATVTPQLSSDNATWTATFTLSPALLRN
jgi:hypothetical protein